MRGCLDWQRDGLGEPDAIREATAHYRSESDLFGSFIEECCDQAPAIWVPSARLRQEYEKWTAERGVTPLEGPKFTNRMKERGFRADRKQGMRVWMGLEMRP